MADSVPLGPREELEQQVARLRERLELDPAWERLEVKLLPPTEREAGADLMPVLDAFLSELDLDTLGPDLREAGWRELTPEEAVRALTYLLSESMAYGEPKRERADARESALAFLALFGPASRLLTNSDLCTALLPDGSPPSGGWGYGSGRGLTHATFESGIVAVGAGRIGLLWVSDED